MDKIEELENKIKELSEELNKLKEEKKATKRWRAEYDESYWFVKDFGDAEETCEENDEMDSHRYGTGNYFKTKEEAEIYGEKLLIYQQLKDLALELNKGEKIDWNDTHQGKHYIELYYGEKEFYQFATYSYRQIGQIYCLNEHFLDIAKERIGEENLKKLFKEE